MCAMITPRLLIALCLLFTLVCAGCKRGPEFRVPDTYERMFLLRRGTVVELSEVLDARAKDHPTFWTRGEVSIRQDGVRGRSWFEATILYREPSDIRLRGARNPIGTLFEVLVSGEKAWLHLNREGELYEGDLAELRRQAGVAGSLSLDQMMAAILVSQEVKRRLADGTPLEVRRTGAELVLTETLTDGRTWERRVDRRNALVRGMVLRDDRGREELRIDYRRYEIAPNREPLPTELVLTVWGGAAEVSVSLAEFKIDPELVDAAFAPPKAKTVRPLSQVGQREIVPVEEEVGD